MTLTVTHEGHRYEWDASRPVWTSDTGNVIRSKRLTAKLERDRKGSQVESIGWRGSTENIIGRNDMKDHISENISAVIGRNCEDPAIDRYDWAEYWPVVDEHLRVIDVLDSDGSTNHVLADVRDGELAVYDGASAVLISVDLAIAKGFGPYLVIEDGVIQVLQRDPRQG